MLTNPIDREFAQTILDRTVYVTDDILTRELRRLAAEFVSKIGTSSYYIVINSRKFASDALMIIKCFDILDRHNFVGFITDDMNIPEGSNIVIVDDASYSGNNLEATIESISYINKPKIVKLHVLIPYISQFMYNALPKHYNVMMYDSHLIMTINEYRITIGKVPFDEDLFERFKAYDKLKIGDQIPLYFDHTVASADSSFPTIYLKGIIPKAGYYGSLLEDKPDRDTQYEIYNKFFRDLLPPPM
jgi:hypothetical protein